MRHSCWAATGSRTPSTCPSSRPVVYCPPLAWHSLARSSGYVEIWWHLSLQDPLHHLWISLRLAAHPVTRLRSLPWFVGGAHTCCCTSVLPPLQGQRAEACKNHLHQMHICLPSRKGHTRLLYRMSLDFMNWTRFVPGIQIFWQNIANQVCRLDAAPSIGASLMLLLGSFVSAPQTLAQCAAVRTEHCKASEAVCWSAC